MLVSAEYRPQLEELLLWWFRDNLKPGHEPSWAKKDPASTSLEGADDDGGVMDHAREMFRKYDTDGGGEIDAGEFTALCYGAPSAWPAASLCPSGLISNFGVCRHGFLLQR